MQMPADRREAMSAQELLEEAELRFPEKIASIETKHSQALEAIEWESEADQDLIEDLEADLRSLLRI
jgi:hypothetical protein